MRELGNSLARLWCLVSALIIGVFAGAITVMAMINYVLDDGESLVKDGGSVFVKKKGDDRFDYKPPVDLSKGREEKDTIGFKYD